MTTPLGQLKNHIEDVVKSTNTPLKFITWVLVSLVLGIVGMASCSKLPMNVNLIIIGIMLFLFSLILLVTFFKLLQNPRPFIFNQHAHITVMQQEYEDSLSNKSYSSHDPNIKLKEAPLIIEDKKENTDDIPN